MYNSKNNINGDKSCEIKNPLKCLQLKKKIKQRHNSYMQQHTFNINIYTEFNLEDVILAIP